MVIRMVIQDIPQGAEVEVGVAMVGTGTLTIIITTPAQILTRILVGVRLTTADPQGLMLEAGGAIREVNRDQLEAQMVVVAIREVVTVHKVEMEDQVAIMEVMVAIRGDPVVVDQVQMVAIREDPEVTMVAIMADMVVIKVDPVAIIKDPGGIQEALVALEAILADQVVAMVVAQVGPVADPVAMEVAVEDPVADPAVETVVEAPGKPDMVVTVMMIRSLGSIIGDHPCHRQCRIFMTIIL